MTPLRRRREGPGGTPRPTANDSEFAWSIEQGRRIREARKAKGWSVAEAANQLGIDTRTLQHWEKGFYWDYQNSGWRPTRPGARPGSRGSNLQRISEVLGMPIYPGAPSFDDLREAVADLKRRVDESEAQERRIEETLAQLREIVERVQGDEEGRPGEARSG